MSSEALAAERANPRSLPQPLTSICGLLVVIGVATFAAGLYRSPQTTWLAFQSNWVFYAFLAQAGVILSCIFTIVGAKWPGPVKRIAESLGAWVPVSFVLALVGVLGGDALFEWQRTGAVHGKEPWLNPMRFYLTDLGILAVMTVFTVVYLKASLRPALKNLADEGEGFGKARAAGWTKGWRGDDEEREASLKTTRRLAPIMCMLFGVGYTVIAFDQVMSMEQTWFSNLFGAFVCWGGILSAVAATALVAVLNRNTPGFEGTITKDRLHDLGKMMFAFSIFWMYLFFSQYLVIWYGNLPEETLFFRDRLGAQFVIDKGFTESAVAATWTKWNFDFDRFSEAYGWLSMTVWACIWILPFWLLLGQKPKQTWWWLGGVATVMLIGFWLERNLLIWPSVVKGDGGAWFGAIQLGIAAGFLGAFILVFQIYTRLFPTLVVPKRS
ncbi:MAG: hypothetical protein MJE66_21050 [Proteobacteria bacterium]|nr:hypothetical protein [Pseudomonadota bacterium]